MSPSHEPGRTERDDARADTVVDARGLRCPLPVIRLAELARVAPPGTVVQVWATDPAARADIPAWCRMRGHRYVTSRDEGDHTAYVIEVLRPSTPAAGR